MLLDAIRVNLHEEKQQEQQRHLDEEVVEKLLALTNFELPQSLVEQELERQYEESRERLSKMNFQWEQYLAQTGKTDEQMREDMRPQAEKNVRVGLSLGRVVELEGIENTDQAPRKALDRLIEIASANQK